MIWRSLLHILFNMVNVMLINLVLDENEIKNRCGENSFQSLDFSKAWINTLEKETGKSGVFDISSNPLDIFPNPSIVVVSSSVREPSRDFMEKAKDFAYNGGILILEMPSHQWNVVLERELVPGGVEISTINKEKALKRISPRILPFPYIDYLEDMPVYTRLMQLKSVPDDMEVLFNIGEYPGLIQWEYGGGWIIFLMFDFAMQMTAMKQGVPSEDDYRVKEKFGKVPFVIETEDLAVHKKMLDNTSPYADILEKFLFSSLEDLKFFPRLWYFPYKNEGVFLMSHDDEKRGRKESFYMVEEEGSRGYTSTFFVTCPPGAECRWENAEEDIIKEGFDIQWHWNRFPDNIKIFSPEEQVENYNKIDGVKLTSCRIHFLNWGDHYTEPFRIMEKSGVLYDSSYGPNKGKGYVFGTGMPFHPINTDGRLFDLFEIPFHTQEDWGGVTQKFFDEFIKNSKESYHSVIVPLFHPHKTAKKEGKTLWLNSFHFARENDHWITTFSKFGNFYKDRCRVEIETLDNKAKAVDKVTVSKNGCGEDIYIPAKMLIEAAGIEYIHDVHPRAYIIKDVPEYLIDRIALRLPLEKEWKNDDGENNREAVVDEDSTPVQMTSRIIKDAGRHYLLVKLSGFQGIAGDT